jgi:hypothetical protein
MLKLRKVILDFDTHTRFCGGNHVLWHHYLWAFSAWYTGRVCIDVKKCRQAVIKGGVIVSSVVAAAISI